MNPLRHYRFLPLTLLIVSVLLPGPRIAHIANERCFLGEGACISDRFLTFWEQNGGLPVFGYATGNARPERDSATSGLLARPRSRSRQWGHQHTRIAGAVRLSALGSTLHGHRRGPICPRTRQFLAHSAEVQIEPSRSCRARAGMLLSGHLAGCVALALRRCAYDLRIPGLGSHSIDGT